MLGCTQPGIRHAPISERAPIILEVPFFPDDTNQCGPSTLASVLNFWGKTTTPEELKREIFRSKLKGALSVDMLLTPRSHGMSAEMLEGGLPRLKKELAAGHPLIVFVNLGFRFIPIGHYMVVIGYDDRRQAIYVHSGRKKNEPVSYQKFLNWWEKTEQWTLLILPPAR